MTKKPINYSNSSIYKIVCKDPSITDCYVGSTTNLIKRRASHKFDCNNEKDKRYNFYVYQFIREHGGFDNFQIIEIEKFNDCEDKESLLRRERYYLEKLGATLNKVRPTRTQKEYYKDNKELFKEKHKDYYEANKELIKEKHKDYYEQNKEKLKKKMTCECGSIIVKNTKQRHYRSIKHQNYLNNLNLN